MTKRLKFKKNSKIKTIVGYVKDGQNITLPMISINQERLIKNLCTFKKKIFYENIFIYFFRYIHLDFDDYRPIIM